MIASFFSRFCLCLLGSTSVGAALLSTAQAEEIEAVSSRVSADYVRAKLPDGSFQPETYAFAKGGYRSSGTQDYSIDKIQFLDVARTIAGPLATQRYIPTKDPKTTRLLVMVYWGATASLTHSSDSAGYQNLQLAQGALSSAQMDSHGMPAGGGIAADQNELDASLALVNLENHIRDRADAENAALLGYDSWWDKYSGHAVFGTALAEHKQEMIDELEEGRYFVVLMAYDFQLLLNGEEAQAALGDPIQRTSARKRIRQAAGEDGAICVDLLWPGQPWPHSQAVTRGSGRNRRPQESWGRSREMRRPHRRFAGALGASGRNSPEGGMPSAPASCDASGWVPCRIPP